MYKFEDFGFVEIVNLTPHEVSIALKPESMNDVSLTLPPAEVPARVSTIEKEVGAFSVVDDNGNDSYTSVPVIEVEFGEIENLPDPIEGRIYVVSRIVAEAAKERKDLFIPARLIRDDEGRIIGCNAISRI